MARLVTEMPLILAIGLGLLLGGACDIWAAHLLHTDCKVKRPFVACFAALIAVSLLWCTWGEGRLLRSALLACILLVIALVDWESWCIPDSLVGFGLLGFPLVLWLEGQFSLRALFGSVMNGCVVAGFLLCFVVATDHVLHTESMGGGDIKLFFLLGIYLGMPLGFLTLFAACLLGLAGQLVQRQFCFGYAFPFGPSIALAAWLTMLWGQRLLNWYLPSCF